MTPSSVPIDSTSKRRPALVTASIAGVVIALLGLAGVFAASTDRATTGENAYQTDAFDDPQQGDVDLVIAAQDSEGGCGTYADNLTTGLFSYEATGGEFLQQAIVCLANQGDASGPLSVSVIDLDDRDVDCTGSESTVDDTCGTNAAGSGELSGILDVEFQDCTTEEVYPARTLEDLSATSTALGTLDPEQERCFFVSIYPPEGEAEDRLVQTDRATWRFAFDLGESDAEPCVETDAEDNDSFQTATPIAGAAEGTHCPNDADVYSYSHNGGGDLTFFLQHQVSDADLDLLIHVEDPGEPGSFLLVGQGLSSTNDELVTLADAAADTYYATVVGDGAAEYILEVGPSPACVADPGNDTLSGASPIGFQVQGTICDDDEDWYSYSHDGSAATFTLDFRHSWGDLDLALTDENGNVLATSESLSDQEQLSLGTGDSAGTYYLRVYSFPPGASNLRGYTLTKNPPPFGQG